MTEAELKKAIQEKTQLPAKIVAHVIDVEHALIAEALGREEDVFTPTIKLHSKKSKREVIDPKSGHRKVAERVILYVKPRRKLRAFLNKITDGDSHG